jgi:hypothetical protein
MIVRIRLRTRTSLVDLQSQAALGLAAVLAPSALVAFTMCFWSFAAELRLAGAFFVTSGMFAHWQMWFFAALVLLVSTKLLASYGTASVEIAIGRNSNFHNANPHFAEE